MDAKSAAKTLPGWVKVVISVGLITVLAVLLFPIVWPPRPTGHSPVSRCRNNLKQIGLALHNYHDKHGHFPPAWTVDEQGNRLHSWRTLLLPYIEQKKLFSVIDLSKPWDHPTNAKARGECPTTYQCDRTDLPDGFTSYKALVGAQASFPPDGSSRRIDDMLDGTSLTGMVVETTAEHSVHWMNPHDDGGFEFLQLLSAGPTTAHADRPYLLLADGSLQRLRSSIPGETLEALGTHAGGETIDLDTLGR
jgi:hypothetical protein